MNSKIILKSGREESLLRYHPWVFSGAIARVEGRPEEGSMVDVLSADGTFRGVGHYQIGNIAVRILSFSPVEIDEAFWEGRLQEAFALRRALGLAGRPDNNTCRLVHGEGDRLPGLVVDLYGTTAVMQAHSVGMHHARAPLANALKNVLGDALQHVYYKSEGTLPFKAALGQANESLYGCPEADAVALEKGLRFRVDWLKGQKTGFFIDQRDNRLLLERYAAGRSVLNMFCYTGGFSVYALRGGATLVHSVDSSARAVALAEENVALNFPDDTRHRAFAEDAFDCLAHADDLYDLIILDPPAFAKHRNVLRNALLGYRKLNALAFEKIRPGGLLFTFSCSQVVSRTDFRLAVFSAAAQSGRHVRILHQLTQPADHPVAIYHPEGEYLKGLMLSVE
ncbi:MAG: class I SAM-dependent rRNA methyltransferase [Tannerella sp.]|jgi:23S rRNA (cytosine1962-C5)-methyltransferase|nr:class I SAM-dependent rRNA methyltransferase [Tannerella sp.]